MSNNLKLFITKAVLFTTLLIIVDYSVGSLLRYFYFKHDAETTLPATYVASYCDQQLLIIGASHAHHHYIAKEIADSTGLTSYNAGADGLYILNSYAMLKFVLHRYSPHTIILDIRPNEFVVDQANYDRLSILFPFYAGHPEIRGIVRQQSEFAHIKLLSKTYPFNSQLLSIIKRNIHKNEKEFKPSNLLGYEPLVDTIPADKVSQGDYYHEDKSIDANIVNTYKSFLANCIERHVNLYIFISPALPQNSSNTLSIRIASKIAAQNHLPFFNYADAPVFKNRLLFQDNEHLNDSGARLYTQLVIKDITANNNRLLPKRPAF